MEKYSLLRSSSWETLHDKDDHPKYRPYDDGAAFIRRRQEKREERVIFALIGFVLLLILLFGLSFATEEKPMINRSGLSIAKLQTDYDYCSRLRSVPRPPLSPRERSARYVEGHGPVLIRNATVWTGELASGTPLEAARPGKGYSWVNTDVLMEYGLIKRVAAGISDFELPHNCSIYDAAGRQLTSGIVDMHSHATVDTLPELRGSSDDNELSSDVTPYVRSLDAINPLDHQLQVIKSGGVTTSLILPGSGNNMGGEAFVIKHAVGKADGRDEISAADMLADPDKTWRYMKMACGENAKAVYGRVGQNNGPFSRMGEAWYFRHAFEQATALVQAQDDWCNAADVNGSKNMKTYIPEDLQWESLGALLRGQVLLNTHCYTVPDLEAFVRHTNEFKFEVQAFHHAHQTYLVPEILKRAYGGKPPAAALFADNMYYKAEAYIASEQVGKILWEKGITPVYVSDNPVLNAQHVVFEAAKAYRNGLPYHVALAGVTSASAELLGLGERIGKVKAGYDADVVVWDSDPLSVGAAPVQVWIDGTPQFNEPVELKKALTKPLIETEEVQDLHTSTIGVQDVIFSGVSKIMLPGREKMLYSAGGYLVVRNGSIVCSGSCELEIILADHTSIRTIQLKNGYVVPPATAFGSALGLAEIDAEGSTQDGALNDETISRAVDGLALDGKNLKVAYDHGVTRAISAPLFKYDGYKGLSAGFLTGAEHSLEKGAVWQEEVALHYALTKSPKASALSAAVGQLRAKLLMAVKANATQVEGEERWLKKVVSGELPLVLMVHSSDLIASIIRMKAEVDGAIHEGISSSKSLRLVVHGGAESWILAKELAEAKIGVVLAPFLAYAETWDQRRSLTGAPLTNGTAIDVLHAAGVKVAIGTKENWETRNLYLSAGIALANGDGKISDREALGFVTSNIYDMLGIEKQKSGGDEFVVFDGSPLEMDGQVRAVADGRGKVDVWV